MKFVLKLIATPIISAAVFFATNRETAMQLFPFMCLLSIVAIITAVIYETDKN